MRSLSPSSPRQLQQSSKIKELEDDKNKSTAIGNINKQSAQEPEEIKEHQTYFHQSTITTSSNNKDLDTAIDAFEQFPFKPVEEIKTENTDKISLKENLAKLNTIVCFSSDKLYLSSMKFVKTYVKKTYSKDLSSGEFEANLKYKIKTNSVDLNCINSILTDHDIMHLLSIIVNDENSMKSFDENLRNHELALSSTQPKFITNEQLYGDLKNKTQYLKAHENLTLHLDSAFMTESLDLYKGHECLYSDIGLKISIPDSFKNNDGFFKLNKDIHYSDSEYPNKFIVNKFDIRTAEDISKSYFCFSTYKDPKEGIYRRSFSGARYIQFQAFNSELMNKVIAELFSDPLYVNKLYKTKYELHQNDCHTFCQQIRETYIKALIALDPEFNK